MHTISHARFLRSLKPLSRGLVVTASTARRLDPREQLLDRGATLKPGVDPLADLTLDAQLLWRELDLLAEPDARKPWAPIAQPPDLNEVRATQTALFQHFGDIFGAIAGMEHRSCTLTADELTVLAHSRESRADVANAVQAAIEDLADFYFAKGPAIRQHCMQLGGIKTLIDKGPSFERNVITGIRKLGLYVDTQLLPDPFAPVIIEAAQHGSLKGWHQLAPGLRRVLQLEPLVVTQLPSMPLLLFPSRQAFQRTYPTSVNTDVPQLWVQGVGIALGVPEPTQLTLEQRMELEPSEMISNLFRAGILPNYGLDPDTHVGLCEQHMSYQWKRSPQFSQRNYGDFIWALIRTTFTSQYSYFEELQAMGAHPFNSTPQGNRLLNLWNQFNADSVAMMAESKSAAPAVDAISNSNFVGLTNASVPQLVELLKLGENVKFREQLGSFTVDLTVSSAQERALQASHLQSKIQALIAQHKIELDANAKAFNKSLLPAVARAGVAGASLIGGIGAFVSTLPWLGKAAASYGKAKVDQRQVLKKTQRSLIAVIASNTASADDL